MVLSVDRPSQRTALVTLSESASRDTFSSGTIEHLIDTIDGLIQDEDTDAVILTGTGRFFCAGGPVDKFDDAIDDGSIGDVVEAMTGHLHPLLLRIRRSSTVFIGAINGAAAGGGLGLALSMDYRICVPNAKLAASFFRLGLSPDGGTTWRLPRLVGQQAARTFFFENSVWDGPTAQEKGAVDEVVNEDELINRSIEIATNWSQWGNHFREATKHLLHVQTLNDFETHLKHEQTLIEAAGTTMEFKDGVTKFLK